MQTYPVFMDNSEDYNILVSSSETKVDTRIFIVIICKTVFYVFKIQF
jgi:hypothetical protein